MWILKNDHQEKLWIKGLDDKIYTAWKSYAQSKLAQMMFAYELQRRVEAAERTSRFRSAIPARHEPVLGKLAKRGASNTPLNRSGNALCKQ